MMCSQTEMKNLMGSRRSFANLTSQQFKLAPAGGGGEDGRRDVVDLAAG